MWIAAIQPTDSEDEVPFSLLQADGLAPRTRVPLSESQNLRRLRTAVSGLGSGSLSEEQYAEQIDHVMEMAHQKWVALEPLGESEVTRAAGLCFEELYRACELMLERPESGLRRALEAFEAIDRLESELLELLSGG